MILKTDPLDGGKLDEFKERYGSTANAYLRGERAPQKITGVKHVWGVKKGILDKSLFEDTALHKKHMCRILAIYMDEDDFGKRATNFSLTNEQKRDGFLRGIWGPKELKGDDKAVDMLLWYPKPKQPTAAQQKKYTQLWPAVFPIRPPPALSDTNIQEMSTKSRKDEDLCESRAFKKWYSDCRKKHMHWIILRRILAVPRRRGVHK